MTESRIHGLILAEYEAGSRATAALDTATKARQLMAQAELLQKPRQISYIQFDA